jgi:lysophospholipase L1-like esterase
MKTSVISSLFLFPACLVAGAPSGRAHSKPQRKEGAFYLAGDSTTAGGDNPGGWGDGFLETLLRGSIGTNYGHSGATTVSFVAGGDWATVIESVTSSAEEYDTFVTIQFGHNDQKATSGVSIEQFQANLERMVFEVRSAGGTPILVTSLSRRKFKNGTISLDLEDVVEATKAAAASSGAAYVDLNAASMAYLNAIGEEKAMTYNLAPDDRTHLNTAGNVLFGNMVSWLLTTTCSKTIPAKLAARLRAYTAPREDIVEAFESGEYIYPDA